MTKIRSELLAVAVAALIVAGPPAAAEQSVPAATSEPATTIAAEYVGSETCVTCHDDVEGPLARTAHGSDAFAERSDLGCEACHGPGSLHMEDPENLDLRYRLSRQTALRASQACLACHAQDQPRFHASPHAMTGMSCVSCHSIHGEQGWALADDDGPFQTARVTGPSAQCVECHDDVGAEFELNERHRLQEGILGCASCHDPHAPAIRTRLGGFKHEACVDCHADKGGPFVFEHGSVRVEGCTACHTPHGSPNRHLLAHQDVAELCYSCHVEVPGFHISGGRFSLDTQCTNCHSAIHGSNFSPVFFK